MQKNEKLTNMGESGLLFNSKNDPIPGIRKDINIVPVENNGNSYLLFHDQLGYTPRGFALDRGVGPVLTLLDGRKSISDLAPYLGNGVTAGELLEYIRFLDENRLLHSEYFRHYAEKLEQSYESSQVHEPASAGISYPADPDELQSYLDGLFAEYDAGPAESVKALYAPHIDPRVTSSGYVKAFGPIRNLRPKRVVILATSHYCELYPNIYDNRPFILTEKDFKMPLGTVKTDKEAVRQLSSLENAGVTVQDRAHRIEHSIELHLLYLGYLWDHDFAVVPILVGSFDDLFYMENGHLNDQINRFSRHLNHQFGDDSETLFLISGDLSHFGKKFGDNRAASAMIPEVQSFDRQFLTHAEAGNEKAILRLLKDRYDPYRVCGYPPLFTLLRTLPGIKGDVLSYEVWNERERESAVTYGSILYRSN